MITTYTPTARPSISQTAIEESRFRAVPDYMAELGLENPLSKTWDRFDAMYAGPSQPNPEAARRAKQWIKACYNTVYDMNGRWMQPHVTAQGDGEIVLEWWKGPKSLTVFISSNEIGYLRCINTDPVFDEGDATSSQTQQYLWNWLSE